MGCVRPLSSCSTPARGLVETHAWPVFSSSLEHLFILRVNFATEASRRCDNFCWYWSSVSKHLGQASIGERVVTRHGTILKVGNAVVDDENRGHDLAVAGKDRRVFRVYQVQQVKGSWVWLVSENDGVQGWTKVENLIKFDQAIDDLTARLKAKPSPARYNDRGNIWRYKKMYDLAIADYNDAIRLDPRNAVAFHNRGIAWQDKHELDKALIDYTEAIRLEPKHSSPYVNRGIIWNAKNEPDKALADYNEAIELDPHSFLAYHDRGNVWFAKKDLDKALADYNEAIRLNPTSNRTYYRRGNAWFAKKELDKALADYTEAIRLNPKDHWSYLNRGFVWVAMSELDKALADYNEAIRLDPTFSLAYWGRAWLWATCPEERFRDGAKAVESATRACELHEWKVARFVSTLAAACAESGDFEAAVKWQQKALELLSMNEDQARNDYDARLELYRSRKPYRDEGMARGYNARKPYRVEGTGGSS